MGITAKKYFENIYNSLFDINALYGEEEQVISIRQALCTVIILSSFYYAITSTFDASILSTGRFTLLLIGHVISILFLWFITGCFFEYIAKIFDKSTDLKRILFYTSFAYTPYLLFAPLSILKQVGNTGYVFGSMFSFLLYLWIIILYVFSIRKAYNISFARSFMMILLPFIASFFAIYWLISFCVKLGYIFSV